jgi:hypothetical protein
LEIDKKYFRVVKYIYGHLGLGDHVVCNGLYRELMKSDEKYTIFVKKHNTSTVRFMLRDLINVELREVNDDNEVMAIINNEDLSKSIIKIGFCQIPLPGANDFDDTFYIQHNISFEKRWSSFRCDRNLKLEKKLFNKYNVKEGEYVFIHDDKSRGYEIDESYIINKDLPIVRPILGLTKNSFDYCYLMQNSFESHFIDSSFRLIFDSLQLRNSNLFFHINLKNGITRGYKPHSKLDFKII